MEDKKTLWIILGIGICVLAVVAVGFFWFLPDGSGTVAAGGKGDAVQAGRAGFDPVEWVRQEENFPGIEDKTDASDEFTVITEDLVYGSSDDETAAEAVAEDSSAEVVQLAVPRTEAKKAETVEIKAAAPVRRTQPAPAPAPQRQPVKVTEYWIQAGSFSALDKADEVKTALNEKGATSTISTTNVNGTNYYRVRLGPYSEKMEAEKFLDWIRAVKGFESSYISEVYVTR